MTASKTETPTTTEIQMIAEDYRLGHSIARMAARTYLQPATVERVVAGLTAEAQQRAAASNDPIPTAPCPFERCGFTSHHRQHQDGINNWYYCQDNRRWYSRVALAGMGKVAAAIALKQADPNITLAQAVDQWAAANPAA